MEYFKLYMEYFKLYMVGSKLSEDCFQNVSTVYVCVHKPI